MLQSTSQSLLRSAQTGGRQDLLQRKENLKTAEADKACYEREVKTYIPPKGETYIPPKGETKTKFKDPNISKRPLLTFLFCSEYCSKIKGKHSSLSIGNVAKKLGEMWNNIAADDRQPYKKKAAELKNTMKRIVLPPELKENLMQ
ncbi:High mobility group protein B1 [Sciurus carolinensis]|uniref:High mobility group protein B1 n=1 Tax=Sciurus carolinensis TaxID=30640 RepID=A0AA41SYL1_SCICA|nr:High mobility group protein B1 [Sciurus carolinensis]